MTYVPAADQCTFHPEQARPCPTCGAARARAAIRTRPGTHDTDPDPTRARAIARARQDRTNAKEDQS